MARDVDAPRRGIIVGLGSMGTLHARVLRDLPAVEIVAAVDLAEERRDAFRASHQDARTYPDVTAALEAVEVDFACVATPPAQLAATARVLVERGVPLLVEKPVAADEAEALELIREAEVLGVPLAAGQVERCNPAVIALKQKLDEGAIGRVYQLHARRLSPFPDRDSLLGVSLDLATHDIDVFRYLTGSEVKRVYAEVARRLHENAEDLIAATLRLDNEATGVLEVNWLTPTKVRELTVTGEGGTFVLNYLSQELYYYAHPTAVTSWDTLANMRGAGEGDMVRYAMTRREPLVVQWESFLGALRGTGQVRASGYDGYAALSTAQAIQRSGASHQPAVPGYRSPGVDSASLSGVATSAGA